MMVLPVSSQSKKPLPSAVDKCRYVRTINLLPGVEHGSSTKRVEALPMQAEKENGSWCGL